MVERVRLKKKRQMSKNKGSRFERTICQRLSLWVSNLTREDVFWRSAMSGGRATLRARKKGAPKHTAHEGDIVATHELGHALLHFFVIECKHYRDLNTECWTFGRECKVSDFWKKVKGEAKGSNRHPMLVFRQNNRQEMVGVDKAGLNILRMGGSLRVYLTVPPLGLYIVSFREMVTDLRFRPLRKAASLRAIQEDME